MVGSPSSIILQGDCLAVLKTLPASYFHTVVTSPPYYGLRDYGTAGQIGLEPSVGEFVVRLVEVFREVRRVLRDDGTAWLNLGDSYAAPMKGSGGTKSGTLGGGKHGQGSNAGSLFNQRVFDLDGDGLKVKDLIGVPWRVALALQADGWYLRSEIIWAKPNPMPESIIDRPTKAHEQIFLLSKTPTYYYDHEAVKEDAVGGPSGNKKRKSRKDMGGNPDHPANLAMAFPWAGAPKRNRRTVWTITTKPYKGAHFAVFPPELVEPCILAGSSEKGCCAECGVPWTRVTEKQTSYEGGSGAAGRSAEEVNASGKWAGVQYGKNIKLGPVVTTTTGWKPDCSCNASVVPCRVLDPFSGSGTTGLVALQHGRAFIGIDLNPSYVELASNRLKEAGFATDVEMEAA